MRHDLMVICMVLLVSPLTLAGGGKSDRKNEVKRLKRATEVFSEIMGTPDKGIPEELLDRCECAAIIPGMSKGGIGVGGRYGKGIVMCRRPDKKWSAPSFFT